MPAARILIIDDDLAVCEAVADALSMLGYQADYAESATRALAMMKKRPPAYDLVLLDLMMPEMNGWEFRDAQRKTASIARVPVVVVSAVEGISIELKDKVEAAAFLRKPVTVPELRRALERIVGPAEPQSV
jgi:two-component system, chemotaxis family, chemotaxis protein CheY